MNTYYITDEDFLNTDEFKEFMISNPERGNLRIRAYAANEAIPIKGVKVVVFTMINPSTRVIFFEGETDESGVIEKLSLPAPKLDDDNMLVPNKTEYEIDANYVPDNISTIYKVDIYEDVCVEQKINIVPELKVGGFNGR